MTRRLLVTVALVVAAAALQTTLFARIRPLDAAPALGVLIVIAVARHLPPELAVLVGFLAGLLDDLLSETPLGLWSLVLTTVAFVVVRFRERMEDDFTLIAPLVFVFSFGALALFAVLGTIFGEKTLADAGLVRKMLLPSAYNVLLAAVVLPATTRLLGAQRRRGAAFEL